MRVSIFVCFRDRSSFKMLYSSLVKFSPVSSFSEIINLVLAFLALTFLPGSFTSQLSIKSFSLSSLLEFLKNAKLSELVT